MEGGIPSASKQREGTNGVREMNNMQRVDVIVCAKQKNFRLYPVFLLNKTYVSLGIKMQAQNPAWGW